ncbi:hypothetical protein Droror1_Dr00020900 [Drosera rotundifolia]
MTLKKISILFIMFEHEQNRVGEKEAQAKLAGRGAVVGDRVQVGGCRGDVRKARRSQGREETSKGAGRVYCRRAKSSSPAEGGPILAVSRLFPASGMVDRDGVLPDLVGVERSMRLSYEDEKHLSFFAGSLLSIGMFS